MRRVTEHGAYSRAALIQKKYFSNYFSSEDKQVSKLFRKYQCPHHLLHLDQAADKIHKLLRHHTQIGFQKCFLHLPEL